MVEAAQRLAAELAARGVPVFAAQAGFTRSHQFAIRAADYGGGQTAARRLRRANLLTSGIGLPVAPVDGDTNGLRVGTPEAVRLGMTADDMPELAGLIVAALEDPEPVGGRVTEFRRRFAGVAFTQAPRTPTANAAS
jgi:glycine hydroxymethyltransferase